MNKVENKNLDEVYYCDVLENGLQVTIVPKESFSKSYALFTTNYGSIDNSFVPLGESNVTAVPDGIAHFLEHKLFEKETGDIFQVFGQQGASANAFTSFTRTSYLFSCTEGFEANLKTLLDFVQEPYFTEETVEKEKGIIAQEIQMYQDDPNWRQFFGVIGNLYPNHPLSIDIAGTVKSIQTITAEHLHTCYQTFYHPSNMNLVVVGNVNPEETIALVKNNQSEKEFLQIKGIERRFPPFDKKNVIPKNRIQMDVNRSKVSIGIKGNHENISQENRVLYQAAANLLCQLLFGDTSTHYQTLYDQGLIDDTFGFEFTLDREFCFADFGGDTNRPEELASSIKEILLGAATDENLNSQHLDLLKRKATGKFLQSLNSLEYIATKLSQLPGNEKALFEYVAMIDSIQLDDIKMIAQELFVSDLMTEFYIDPLESLNKK
ncbi:insulinase family protein [Vagococcus coleopterorum]|uniref:Insulinase family protein n=1 Tax=Vagococcus coleopterorum TaxID=2714946 RepID=A0A6G8ALM6_9ENTE|nr:pitrilysin family protein [Vagococcus coleopterorum]QIL45906.1 insulinase family protein [Vagococcus coleopterorum]